MENCKFKEMVINIHKDCKNRTFKKEEFGCVSTYNNYFGYLYDSISIDKLDEIIDIKKYMDKFNPDMLMLHSRVTNEEIEVYKWNFKDYEIKNDKLIVNFDSGNIKKFSL